MVITASTAASTRYVVRQSRWPAIAAVSGANTVLDRPATKVRTVSAPTWRGPYQRVNAANAGGYNTAPIATPAAIQAATNHSRFGENATPTMATGPSTAPALITPRGPWRSSQRPTTTPTSAEVTSAAEKAAVTAGCDHPVRSVIRTDSTVKA